MNIIEAGKALEAGKTVLDPDGYKHRKSGRSNILIGDGEEWGNAFMYLDDILSEKWTVLDE